MDRRSFFRLPAAAALAAVAPRVTAAPAVMGVDLASGPDKSVWMSMWYNGTEWCTKAHFGMATSPDGINWTRR